MKTKPQHPARTVEVALGHETLRVRINGLLHLNILHEKLIGFQSWEKGRPAHGWLIEFHTTDGPILAEYADRALWSDVLKGLEVALRD